MMKIYKQFGQSLKISVPTLVFCTLCMICQQDATALSFKSFESQTQIWGRIRNNFNFSHKQSKAGHPKIQKYVKQYAKAAGTVNTLSKQAKPYLFYIVQQLEARKMPGELALLPMIESRFKPTATSNKGAAGLWQFMPATGRSYGLKQNAVYDARRDIQASTKAALDYLQFLHKEFDHNWMLALAAYNAGEGKVRGAIKRNKKAGKPTGFWDLKLPKQTQEYVPKLLALAEVIGDPKKHDISLPHIANKPYFVAVNPGTKINLNEASKLANINVKELKLLNPGLKTGTLKTSAESKGTPKALLVPVASAEKFESNLAKEQ